MGLTFPLSTTFYSTAGRPPIIPDLLTTEATNEPYLDVCFDVIFEKAELIDCVSGLIMYSAIPTHPRLSGRVIVSNLRSLVANYTLFC